MHRHPHPHRSARLTALAALLAALLVGLFLGPTTALAAPALTMAPAAVPPGGAITIAGTGFAPNAPLELFAVIPYFNDARVQITAVTAGADGAFSVATRVPGYYSPGPWVVVVVGAGGDLARASITVTAAPSVASERLTVMPTTGAVGTRFAATGTGLPPGLALRAFTTESAKGPTGHFRQVAQLVVAADGRATFPIDTTGYDPAGYDLTLVGPEATLSDPGGVPSGFPLVIAQFVVTAPSAPTPAAADPATVVRRYFDTRNRYDIAGTLALVTDDVRIIGGPRCTEASPCVGKDAVRTDLQSFIAQHTQTTIVGTPQVAGTTVRVRIEARADNISAAGVDRFINDTTLEVRDGLIASARGVPDQSDPQTAQFVEYQRTHPQPGGPMPGLPNTGGGGLAAGADRRGALALGLLGLFVGLCGSGVRARRPGR